MALALCGASTPDDHKLIDRVLAAGDRDGFAARFLEAKGLGWTGELIGRWQGHKVPDSVSQESIPIDQAQDAPAAVNSSLDAARPPALKAAARTATRTDVPPLPGLPGGPPMAERLSPFRVVAGKAQGSGR